jgi:aspartyl-tRNA(Asn)/glutamyl-tRNA(Gln) amidotransferase subunit A
VWAIIFEVDRQVSDAFERAIETIRGFGHPLKSVAVPFGNPGGGLGNIEADRKGIAGQTFKEIDVLLLPTTTTTVPAIRDAGVNPQALSPQNTVFANYYGLPAISVPCGFDSNGLPLGLQMVGKPWDEATVLRLAYRYETTTNWKTKHPAA